MKFEYMVVELTGSSDNNHWYVAQVNGKTIRKLIKKAGVFSGPEYSESPLLLDFLNEVGQRGWETSCAIGYQTNTIVLKRQI